jgi:hypothetical protein
MPYHLLHKVYLCRGGERYVVGKGYLADMCSSHSLSDYVVDGLQMIQRAAGKEVDKYQDPWEVLLSKYPTKKSLMVGNRTLREFVQQEITQGKLL